MKCGPHPLFVWPRVQFFLGLALPGLSLGQDIPARSLQEDFQIMRHALEEAHGGICRYTRKAEMDRTFDKAYRQIDRPMTALEFWRLAAPVVAHIKDGHTYLWFPKSVLAQFDTTQRILTADANVFHNRVFFTGEAYGESSLALTGREILSINGVPTRRILKELRGMMNGDGNSSATDWLMGHAGGFGIRLYGLGIESPFLVDCRDRDGKRELVRIAGMTIPDYLKARLARHPELSTNVDLKFLDEGQIAVLTVRHWYDPGTNLSFLDFLKQLFTQIHERGTTNLIIDVRDDDGGLDIPVINLLGFLLDRPFRLYRDVSCIAPKFDFFKYDPDAKPVPASWLERRADGKFHVVNVKFMELQQPSQPHYAGRVFALMNGGCFSSSTEFLSLLHFYKRAKFIGQEPAGGYYGFTAGYFVNPILPHSKLQLRFGLWTYYQDVSAYKYSDRGVMPDYPVTYSIDDFLAERDKEMELALSLARASETPNARKGRRPE